MPARTVQVANRMSLHLEGMGAHQASVADLRSDYVLIFTLPSSDAERESVFRLAKQPAVEGEDVQVSRHRTRSRFFDNCWQRGLRVAFEPAPTPGERQFWAAHVSASNEALYDTAEVLRLRLPVRQGEGAARRVKKPFSIYSWVIQHSEVLNRLFTTDLTDITDTETLADLDVFRYQWLDKFEGAGDVTTLFTESQRAMLVFHLLDSIPFDEAQGSSGLYRLWRTRTLYTHLLPHDNQLEQDSSDLRSKRFELLANWARWGYWYKEQPIDDVRDYLGEQVAFYFSFLGFYNLALISATVVGLLCFMIGAITHDRTPGNELCASNITVCGLCASCDNQQLNEDCNSYRLAAFFDNETTMVFAIFMSVWASLLLEFWGRRAKILAWRWGTYDLSEAEPIRPLFKPNTTRIDPVTEEEVPHFTRKTRRIAWGLTVVVTFAALVVVVVVAFIIYRIAVREALFLAGGVAAENAAAITAATAAILNLVVILLLNHFYGKIAIRITNWENHRYQSDYDKYLSFKVFVFQFFNYYTSFFYVAFFKGRFPGRPGDYNEIGDGRSDSCPPYGCLFELTVHLGVTMVGKQALNNLQEFVIPYIKKRLATKKFRARLSAPELLKGKNKVAPAEQAELKDDMAAVENMGAEQPWQRDLKLLRFDDNGLFNEYLELVIQFGFVSLFVAAFPLGPFFALLNNLIETRLDAQKFLRFFQRVLARRASNIGVWSRALDFTNLLGTLTNGGVIAFTSEFVPKVVFAYHNNDKLRGYIDTLYANSPVTDPTAPDNERNCQYLAYRDDTGRLNLDHYEVLMARLAFFIFFENVVFAVKFLVFSLVPETPSAVKLSIKRNEWRAQQALEREKAENNDEEGARRIAAQMQRRRGSTFSSA